MGRPRSHPEACRKHWTTIRWTSGEMVALEQRAAQSGLSRSEFIRQMALSGCITVQQSRSLDAMAIKTLNKLGNLLNQAIKRLHIHGELPPEVASLSTAIEDEVTRAINHDTAYNERR